jgi:UDP-galactopyranose mutase
MKKSKYDFVIVGAGMFGSICARELTDKGYKCLVVDKREHIGGNCYTERKENIDVHMYGPHIFHTSNESIWNYMNRFTKFNNFILSPVANYKGKIFSLPFNMWTFSQMWKYVSTPLQAMAEISHQSKHIKEPKNLEEQAIKLVGKDIYKKLIKGYTWKQWQKHPRKLPKEIIQRLPVRFTWDSNYFNDKYTGIPIGGYTQIFEKMLSKCDVKLNVDYFNDREYYDSISNKIIYTGPIDKFFNYQFGKLEYKSLRWETKHIDTDNFQGSPVINYTDVDVPYTRILEHKWFDHQNQKGTFVSYEYPINYDGSNEPYYPIRDNVNTLIYKKYYDLSTKLDKYIFGGRLGSYVYYDMHQVISQALTMINYL